MSICRGRDLLAGSSPLLNSLGVGKIQFLVIVEPRPSFLVGCHRRPFPTPRGCHCCPRGPCLFHGHLPLQGQQETVYGILEFLWLLFLESLLF